MEERLYHSLSTVASYIVDNVSHIVVAVSFWQRTAVLTHFISCFLASSADNEKGCLIDGADLVFPKLIGYNGYKACQTSLLYVLMSLKVHNVQ